MAKLYRENPVYERNVRTPHKDFERRETRVSEFMRLYSAGRSEQIPECKIQTLPDDPRSEDAMFDDAFCPGMGTEPVEVFQMIDDMMEKYEAAIKEIKDSANNCKKYKNALSVYKNPNSSQDQKYNAAKILRELKID